MYLNEKIKLNFFQCQDLLTDLTKVNFIIQRLYATKVLYCLIWVSLSEISPKQPPFINQKILVVHINI